VEADGLDTVKKQLDKPVVSRSIKQMLAGLGRPVHTNICNPAAVDAGADCRSLGFPVASAIVVDGDKYQEGVSCFNDFNFMSPCHSGILGQREVARFLKSSGRRLMDTYRGDILSCFSPYCPYLEASRAVHSQRRFTIHRTVVYL